PPPPTSTLLPYTTLFRSRGDAGLIPELPTSKTGRRALAGLGVLALIKLIGWILLAVSLARGISQLAASLPASDAAQLLHLLFNTPRTAPGLVDALKEFTTSDEFIAKIGRAHV